ncbi:class I SAM-dependent methyltransferase [Saccharothrix longispora]|uniref:Isonocardicin synthase n=1 Tax=Saccharothrix longispora TaxID=33920 RepID=A0ABU1PV80_9PSEU|nr:class I SAM-dependent methyltransferase [Saccharothrix longispora]MDR6594521.1 isonocardicin synthase [Saccharothrix longispora]
MTSVSRALDRERRVRDLVAAQGFGAPGAVVVWHENCPTSLVQYFLLRRRDGTWLGRRLVGGPGPFSVVEPHMVMGRFLNLRRHGEGVDFRYRACTDRQRRELFGHGPHGVELDFPFPVLDDHWNEQVCPPEAWGGDHALVHNLDAQERHLREHATRLARDLFPGAAPLVFDPACSTGTFLSALATALPHARCLGADLSPAMVRRAAARSVDVVVADAAHPPLPPGSVDLLVVRFLNAEVVRRAAAGPLFDALTLLTAPGGHVFVLGHTPVLLDPRTAARTTGLRLVDTAAALPRRPGLFQFLHYTSVDHRRAER